MNEQAERRAMARRFRELAASWSRGLGPESMRAEVLAWMRSQDDAGALVAEASRRGWLELPGLAEWVAWASGEAEQPPEQVPPNYCRSHTNLWREVVGHDRVTLRVGAADESETVCTFGGVLAAAYPLLFRGNPHLMGLLREEREPGDHAAFRHWAAKHERELQAAAAALLADLVELGSEVMQDREADCGRFVESIGERPDTKVSKRVDTKVSKRAVPAAPALASGASGVAWQEAQRLAEQAVRDAGGVWPVGGVRGLAKVIGCSPGTMHKAVQASRYLSARKAEAAASAGGVRTDQKARAMLEAGELEQRREVDPAEALEQAELDRLIEEQERDNEREKRGRA